MNYQRKYIKDFVTLRNLKSGLDSKEFRARHYEECQNLRKRRRETEADRQRKSNDDILEELGEDVIMLDVNNNKTEALFKKEWITGLFSDKIFEQLSAAYKISGQLLKFHSARLFDEIIKAGMIPRFFELLQCRQNTELQLRSAMALTEISIENIQEFLPAEAIDVMSKLLESSNNILLNEQLVLLLGNIAGESLELRNCVLESGMLKTLLRLVSSSTARLGMLRNGSWALSMLCYGRNPAPDDSKIASCIPVLAELVQHTDENVITDACWAFGYLMAADRKYIRAVIETGVSSRFVLLLKNWSSEKVVTSVLNAVGHIVLGSIEETQSILDCDPSLSWLCDHLEDENEFNLQTICWTISNIAAGNRNQIQALIDSKVYPTILRLLTDSIDEVQREAAWAVRHSISQTRASADQIEYFVSIGCISTLCRMTHASNEEVLRIVLRTLRTILDFQNPDYERQIKSLCDIKHFETLESHENYDVSRYACHILYYFDE